MILSEIKEKNIATLYKDVAQTTKDLELEKMQIKMGKIKTATRKKYLKKTLARMKTLITIKGKETTKNEKA